MFCKSNCDHHIQKQHHNENETPYQNGNGDLIFDDFEMIPMQTIDLDPMMELCVLRKTRTKKKCMIAQQMVYTLPLKKNYQAFVKTGLARL